MSIEHAGITDEMLELCALVILSKYMRNLIEFVEIGEHTGDYEYLVAKQINSIATDLAMARQWKAHKNRKELEEKYQAGDSRVYKEISPLGWGLNPYYDLKQYTQDRLAKLEAIAKKISVAVAPFLNPRLSVELRHVERLQKAIEILKNEKEIWESFL